MPLPTHRLTTGAVACLATGAVTLVAAPTALAAPAPAPLPAPVLSATTVVPGQPFTLTLSGCVDDRPGNPQPGLYYMSADDREHFGNGAQTLPDGSYTFTEQFQPGAALGDYAIQAVCDRYDSDQAYPLVTVTLVATLPEEPEPGKGKGNGNDNGNDNDNDNDKGNGNGNGNGNGKGLGIGHGRGNPHDPAVRPTPRDATDVRGVRPS